MQEASLCQRFIQKEMEMPGQEVYEMRVGDPEQIRHFQDELDKLIRRYRHEYNITYASVIGILFACAQLLVEESKKGKSDGESLQEG